jgi:hypothetical protein
MARRIILNHPFISAKTSPCGARFADRNELLAHLEAEKQRDQTAPEP